MGRNGGIEEKERKEGIEKERRNIERKREMRKEKRCIRKTPFHHI
jgi:hypothetical protein